MERFKTFLEKQETLDEAYLLEENPLIGFFAKVGIKMLTTIVTKNLMKLLSWLLAGMVAKSGEIDVNHPLIKKFWKSSKDVISWFREIFLRGEKSMKKETDKVIMEIERIFTESTTDIDVREYLRTYQKKVELDLNKGGVEKMEKYFKNAKKDGARIKAFLEQKDKVYFIQQKVNAVVDSREKFNKNKYDQESDRMRWNSIHDDVNLKKLEKTLMKEQQKLTTLKNKMFSVFNDELLS